MSPESVSRGTMTWKEAKRTNVWGFRYVSESCLFGHAHMLLIRGFGSTVGIFNTHTCPFATGIRRSTETQWRLNKHQWDAGEWSLWPRWKTPASKSRRTQSTIPCDVNHGVDAGPAFPLEAESAENFADCRVVWLMLTRVSVPVCLQDIFDKGECYGFPWIRWTCL